MPLLNLKVSSREDSVPARSLAEAATDLTASILRKKRDLTAVVVDFARPELWMIGGRILAEQRLASFAPEI